MKRLGKLIYFGGRMGLLEVECASVIVHISSAYRLGKNYVQKLNNKATTINKNMTYEYV